jgi:hypothetical protein
MPVTSQYMGPTNPGQIFNQGQEAGMSMMERAQQIQQRGAQEERQKAIYEAGLPVIQAANEAHIATARATIDHVVQTKQLETKAAQSSGDLNKEFQDIMQLSDYNAKDTALSGFQAKVAWLDQLPAYKPFVDAVNGARVQNYSGLMADMKFTNEKEIALQNNEVKRYQTDQRLQGATDTANIKAAASTLNANTRANAPTDMVKNLTSLSQMILDGNDSGAEAMMSMMQAKGGVTPIHIADSLTKLADSEDKAAAVAKATGNDEKFQQSSTKAQLFRTQAETQLKKATSVTMPTAAPAATALQPKNITPEEYTKIPSGGKYWWNGQEITKK